MSMARSTSASPPPGRPTEARDERVAAHPDEPQCNDGDEEAVAVFVLRDPAPHQFGERAMEGRHCDNHRGECDKAEVDRTDASNTNNFN
jgi:hypothetical protein